MTILFFFQAEDGIRDVAVTGVQTCALPICLTIPFGRIGAEDLDAFQAKGNRQADRSLEESGAGSSSALMRSEERRVGKEWSVRWQLMEREEVIYAAVRPQCTSADPSSHQLP